MLSLEAQRILIEKISSREYKTETQKRRAVVLEVLKHEHRPVAATEIAGWLGLSGVTALTSTNGVLSLLVEEGRLYRVGKGKATRYVHP